MIVSKFSVELSKFPDENGNEYYTITDGVRTKGKFKTKVEAKENMEQVMLNWRSDN